jgi:hypothetical protein
LVDIQSENFLEGGGLLAVLAVAAAGAQFGGTDGAVGVGSGVGEGAAEFAFGGRVGAFAGGVAAVVVDLIDEGVEVLERVEFFIAGGVPLAGRLFGRGLGFGGGQRGGSFHNVTILMILLKEESRPPAIIIVSKLMPKWEVNLRPNPSNLQVQRQYEQLAEPFGFTTDTTAPSV